MQYFCLLCSPGYLGLTTQASVYLSSASVSQALGLRARATTPGFPVLLNTGTGECLSLRRSARESGFGQWGRVKLCQFLIQKPHPEEAEGLEFSISIYRMTRSNCVFFSKTKQFYVCILSQVLSLDVESRDLSKVAQPQLAT